MAPGTGPAPLRALLATPEVARTLSSSMLGRLPYTSVGLLVILRVRESGGDYAQGGVAAGAFALGLALAGPPVGRLVDRRGQRAVLLPCALACAAALVAIALVPEGTPIAAVVALAALAGVTHPPLSGATRALWPDLVPADRRHALYSLEAAALEVTFILGPLLLVGALAGATSPSVALMAGAGLLLAGTTAFASAPSSLRWRPAAAARSAAGALASPALLALIATVVFMGASFGAIEVATTAFAEGHGTPSLVGPLLASWALGSLIGGVVSARGPAPADPRRRLAALLAATAAADVLVAVAPGPPALAAALLIAGCCIAPAFATLYAMVADVAREGTLTESYTWVATGIAAGIAGGSALGGGVVDALSTHAAMGGAAAMAGVAAALVATAGRRLLAAAPAS